MKRVLQRCFFSSKSVKTDRYIGPDLLADTGNFKSSSFGNKNKGKLIPLQGEEALFGIHPVTLALNANQRIFYKLLIIDQELKADKDGISVIKQLAEKRKVKIEQVSKQALDQAVGNAAWNPHQGVVLDCGKLSVTRINSESDFKMFPGSVVPLLVNIIDPMNTGAILRSAHFFGCRSVIVTSDCSNLSPVVSKASSGAMEILNLNVISPKLILSFVKWLRRPENKATVIATVGSATETNNYELNDFLQNQRKTNTSTQMFILFGNEGRGLPPTIAHEAHCRVVIPAASAAHPAKNDDNKTVDQLPLEHVLSSVPFINSLNVSVAAGIFLYQFSQLFKST